MPAKTIRYVATGDWHLPWLDKLFFEKLVKAVREHKPHRVIHLGDMFDMLLFSKFRNTVDHVEHLESVYRDTNDYLRELRLNAPKGCEFVWLWGNHDDRAVMPDPSRSDKATRSLLHWRMHVDNGVLPELAHWREIPYASTEKHVYRIGPTTFIHGRQTSRSRVKAETVQYCRQNGIVIRGHLHRPDAYPVQLDMAGDCDLPYWQMTCGMGLDILEAHYMRHKDVSRWGTGIIIGDSSDTHSPRIKEAWDCEARIFSMGPGACKKGFSNGHSED